VLGIGLVALRAVLFSVFTQYPALVAIQTLDGITGSIMNVLTVVMITDLTAGTGRLNLAQGALGALMTIAASLSTSITGVLVQEWGGGAGFLFIAVAAALGAASAWVLLAETKPAQYSRQVQK
jgi:MFS family permease